MAQLIIHPNPDATIAIVMPAADCGLTIEQIAQKDTPYGQPYFIVDAADLPADWSTSHCWECDFSVPHGTGMGAQRFFIAQANAALTEIAQRQQPEQIAVLPQPDGISDEEYAAYVSEVHTANQRALEVFEAGCANDTARCHAIINQMKAEVLALEGVQL